MRKQGYDLFIKTKETGSLKFKVKLADGTPADFTGWTSNFVVKKDKNTPNTQALVAIANSVWEEGAKDTITVSFTQSFTNRAPEKFYYCLFMTKNSDLFYLAEGDLMLEQGGSK